MDDPLGLTAALVSLLGQLVEEIQELLRSLDALSTSQERDSVRKAEVVIETSRKKFQVWRKTWLENGSDPAISAEELWGDAGWKDIKKLLGSIQSIADSVGTEHMKRDEAHPRIGWKDTLRGSLKRKDKKWAVKRPPLLELAIQLSRSIDELWIYSEVAFDSLHGILSHQLGPPLRDRLLARSLRARTGSLALYEACSLSKADFSLGVDLFGESFETRGVSHRRSSVSSTMPWRLSYHLFAQDSKKPEKMDDIIIESIVMQGEQDFGNTEIVEFDIESSDLAAYESWPPLKSGYISIDPHTAYEPSYFHVAKAPSAVSLEGFMESLVQLLYKERISGTFELEQSLSFETRVHLAFKVVEYGFYLLGTPWLASLNSKRLQRMKTKEQTSFVLEIQTLDLEDLYFEDPNALLEPSQLFSIGKILVEIALSDESNPANIHDPQLRKSKILPLVEKSMGSLYSKAAAYCLQDRQSVPHFGRPEKYKHPDETGWTSYLTELLEDYHAQVFSR